MKLLVVNLGTMDYQTTLAMQEKLLELRQQNKISDMLLLLQHPPTLTLGTRGNDRHILVPAPELKNRGVNIYRVNRGGDVTYHGPGQIVGYPILHLKGYGSSVRGYIHKIEQTFIRLLQQEYQLDATRQEKYHGVWLGNEKITAIGCAVKKMVTMHGFAFNVNTNLNHFSWIHPCGITDKGVTSLQKVTGRELNLDLVNQQIIDHFSRVFLCSPQLIHLPQLQDLLGADTA